MFAAKVGGGLSVGLGFSARYDADPLPGKEKLDTATTLNLIYALSTIKEPEPPKTCPCPEPPPPEPPKPVEEKKEAPKPDAPTEPADSPKPAREPLSPTRAANHFRRKRSR